MESKMSEPFVEDLISFASSQTDNLSISLQGNSYQLSETSNLGHDFKKDLNETFDLNKHAEHPKASSKIETTLEPFNKCTFDGKKQNPNASRRLSEVGSVDSDESLGILPDFLMKDEMTYDFFKTELSSNEIHDGLESKINENPASFEFSPPSDNQFNRISLFLKNISTPLPNFGNPRRLSSTPKIPAVAHMVISENFSSPDFLPDEKEEPIAGSCYFTFKNGINFDDLNSEKPLTSTYKTVPPLQLSHILNELNEETDLVNLKNKPEGVPNNLNITQTFSHNVEDLLSYNHEDSIQNMNALNNTFKIKQPVFKESPDALASLKHFIPNTIKKQEQPNCNKKDKVQTLDSTFEMPGDTVICNIHSEKTFVIDFNSPIATGVSSSSMVKDGMFNETYIESFSKKQENIVDVTFIKDVENDTQTNLENHCNNFHGAAFKPKRILEETFFSSDFKPMKPILEETFSENSFIETKVCSKNDKSFNSENQSVSSEVLKMKVNTVFEKTETLQWTKATQDDSYLIECVSSNSPETFSNNFSKKEEENYVHDRVNLTENENDCSLKKSPLVSLQLGSDATFSKEVTESVDQEIIEFHKNDTTKNINSMIELASDKSLKTLSNTTFIEENSLKDQMDLSKTKNDSVNKVLHSDSLQLSSKTFAERTIEKSDQEMNAFYEKSSFQSENAGELASFILPKKSKSLTFSDKSESANALELSVFQDSNELIEQGVPGLSIGVKDSFTVNASKEIESCNHSISKEDTFNILSKSPNICASTTFIEKNDRFQSDIDFIFTESCEVQIARNSEKIKIGTNFEKVELVSTSTEQDEFQADSNSLKELMDSSFKLPAEDGKIQTAELENSHCDGDTIDVSPKEPNTCLRGAFLKKVTNKLNSLKSCSLEPKSGLVKPTKIVHSRKVSDSRIGQLPIVKSLAKPVIPKRSIISNLNCSLHLNNSTDKSFSKDLNRKISLSCSSASDTNKSECKNYFKKPFGIPLKSSIKKPESNFQKLRLDAKSSNGHIKVNTIIDKQNLLTQPDLISDKNPKMVKSIVTASVNTKGSISSRLSLHEKFPSSSLKVKENGLKSNVALARAPEKSQIITNPKVIDSSKNENVPETNNIRNKYSRHSIATNLPRKFLPMSNSNKVFISKPIATKQISAPAFNSSKPCLLKVPDNMKQPNSVPNRFSLLPKVESHIKISSSESEGKSVVIKRLESENIKSNGLLRKPCVPKAAQFVETAVCTDHVKQKDDEREKTQSASFLIPNSKKQAEQPSSSSIARRIPGKLPQPRKIPAPNYKK